MKRIRVQMMTFATAVALFALTIPGYSQDKPAPKKPGEPKITTETITLGTGDARFNCYVARPAGDKPAPGLVLIHEWWGLNDWIKKQADRYAAMGYVAIAPDLYHGEVATDAEHSHELMRGLADERALTDLKLAYAWLVKLKQTEGKPIGAMGWFMGGGFALKLAIAKSSLACTVVCYGKPVMDVDQLKKIKGPLLGIWGATDRGIEVEPFKKALDKAGAKHTHHIYPGAGHAFLNETNKRGYNKEQATKAWKEIDVFFDRWLKKTTTDSQSTNAQVQCLIIHIPGSEQLSNRDGSELDITTIEDALIDLVDRNKAGELDGHELSNEGLTFYIYGPSSDRLLDAIQPYLRKIKWPKGTHAIKRYGEPGSKEVTVPINP